jgi:alpha-tubulin suppressor-like RCC1 family protein
MGSTVISSSPLTVSGGVVILRAVRRVAGVVAAICLAVAGLTIAFPHSVGAASGTSGAGAAAAESIAAGWGHTCAIVRRTIRCAGQNEFGQLGNDTTSDLGSNPDPFIVDSAQTTIQAVAAGLYHTCALFSPGFGVACWGWNAYGQLGTGDNGDLLAPTQSVGLSDVTSVVAGAVHTCAIEKSGTLWCWGSNVEGELGNGQAGCDPNDIDACWSSTPVGVPGLGAVKQVAAGDEHTCALTTTGHVFCWGSNLSGQLGIGGSPDSGTTRPAKVPGLSNVASIAAGENFTCAVLDNGALRCWGANDSGQLGDGTTSQRSSPVTVIGKGVAAAAAGWNHTCVITTTGGVACWGRNQDGELGDGTRTQRRRPVAVQGLGPGSDATELTAGYQDTCVRLTGDHIQCWGKNDFGQLGNGTTRTETKPTGTLLGGPTVAFGVNERAKVPKGDGSVLTVVHGGGQLQVNGWPRGSEAAPVIGGAATFDFGKWAVKPNGTKTVLYALHFAAAIGGAYANRIYGERIEDLPVVLRRTDPHGRLDCPVGAKGHITVSSGATAGTDDIDLEIPSCSLRLTYKEDELPAGGQESVAVKIEPAP